MRLKKGVKSFGAELKNIPGVKKDSWGNILKLGDEHKIELYSYGNQYINELEIEECKWNTFENEDIEDVEDLDWDYDHDGLWIETQLIRLIVRR